MKVVENRRKEAEEGPLVKLGAEHLVRADENEDDDRENFVEVADLRLVNLSAVRVAVVLEEKNEDLGEGVHRDQGRDWVRHLELGVALNGDLGADAEKEERDLVALEDALRLKVGDDADERLLGRGGLLEEPDPLEEVEGKPVTEGNLAFDRLLLAGRLGSTGDVLKQADDAVLCKDSEISFWKQHGGRGVKIIATHLSETLPT